MPVVKKGGKTMHFSYDAKGRAAAKKAIKAGGTPVRKGTKK